MDFGEIYSEILRRAKKADMTIVSAPPVSFSSSLIHPVCMFVPALTSSHGGFCNHHIQLLGAYMNRFSVYFCSGDQRGSWMLTVAARRKFGVWAGEV